MSNLALNRKNQPELFIQLGKKIALDIENYVLSLPCDLNRSFDNEFILIQCEHELDNNPNMLYTHSAADINQLYWIVCKVLQARYLLKYDKNTMAFKRRF
jgi:hypothetical protein